MSPVTPVLAGMTVLLSVTHVMCSTTLPVRAWVLPCMNSTTKYLDRSVAWEWLKCDMPNFATTFVNTMADTSSPVGVQHTMPKTVLNHPLRILIYMNCLSIENKKPNSRLLSLEP